jgi:hypothetical protein
MTRRIVPLALASLLTILLGLAVASTAQAQNGTRYYHYPYIYYPHSYYPNYVYWPDPRIPFQAPPAYMSYPRYRDPNWRYDMFEYQRYYRGHGFFLDQF